MVRFVKKNFKKKKLPLATKKVDASQNKAIVNLQKEVTKLKEQPELKNTEKVISFTATTGGTIDVVSLTADATDEQGRLGNSIYVTSWQVRFSVAQTSTVPSLLCSMRVLFFRDKQLNATLPLVTDLIDTAGGGGVMLSPYNITIPGRFKIYYDKIITFYSQPQTAVGVPVLYQSYHKFKQQLGHKISYKGSTAVTGNAANNQLLYCVIADTATYTQFQAFSRVYFTDT